jgi:hypothetical protein
MKSIPPFSKELYHGDTVKSDDDGVREGFLDHVKMTKCAQPEPRKGLADFQGKGPDLAGNSSYPEFRKRSDDGLPEFPAPFSKKNLPGGPKKPRTPA